MDGKGIINHLKNNKSEPVMVDSQFESIQKMVTDLWNSRTPSLSKFPGLPELEVFLSETQMIFKIKGDRQFITGIGGFKWYMEKNGLGFSKITVNGNPCTLERLMDFVNEVPAKDARP